jgi:hypothetical protein
MNVTSFQVDLYKIPSSQQFVLVRKRELFYLSETVGAYSYNSLKLYSFIAKDTCCS